MIRILIPILIFSQLSFATMYQYSDSVFNNFIRGCAKGGGSKAFCSCYMNGLVHNVPENELINFNESMHRIISNPNSQIPELHRIWMNGLYKSCKGL